jgi:hypothetical protein
MNHHVNVLFHQIAFWQFQLWMVGFDRAAHCPQSLQSLAANLPAFVELIHANQIPRPNVAAIVNRNIKIVSFITRIRFGFSNIPVESAAREQSGPESAQLIASSLLMVPTPLVRVWKILLPVTSFLASASNDGNPSRNSWQSGMKLSGTSQRAPPIMK